MGTEAFSVQCENGIFKALDFSTKQMSNWQHKSDTCRFFQLKAKHINRHKHRHVLLWTTNSYLYRDILIVCWLPGYKISLCKEEWLCLEQNMPVFVSIHVFPNYQTVKPINRLPQTENSHVWFGLMLAWARLSTVVGVACFGGGLWGFLFQHPISTNWEPDPG